MLIEKALNGPFYKILLFHGRSLSFAQFTQGVVIRGI
jgi:hypothetical protein